MESLATLAAFDKRDRQSNEDVPLTDSIATSQPNTNTVTTYVAATKKVPTVVFPKKEQAVIMNVHEALKLSDYVKALAKITGPKSIIFASRISNNRVCIYMANTQSVDTLVTNHETIYIDNIAIQIRRLITPSKRVIISNVCPSIPHEIIEQSLKSAGLKPVSSISFLRAGIPGDDFNHILSFRRQVYIVPPENDNVLPTSLVIPFEGTHYRIFLSNETMECFLCKQAGHIANNCPNTTQLPKSSSEAEPLLETSNKRPRSPSLSASTSASVEHACLDNITETHNTPTSQMPPPVVSSQPKTKKPTNNKTPQTTKKFKPTNAQDKPNLAETIEIVEKLYKQDPTPFPVTPTDFQTILENTFGSNDPLMEVRRITDDIDGLFRFMENIYTHLPNKTVKSRITRLIKKLKRQLCGDKSDTASNSSLSSQISVDDLVSIEPSQPNTPSQDL